MSRIEEAAVKAAQTAELLRQDILHLSRACDGNSIQSRLAQIACEDLMIRASMLARNLKHLSPE